MTGRDRAPAAPRPSANAVGPRVLIDHSVWGRLATHGPVVQALRSLITGAPADVVHICPPIAAEYGYSTRSGSDHTMVVEQLSAFPDCPVAPTTADVLRIQNALWNGGLLRAVGATDTLIAAYAVANDATVVHYDGDFEHIAAVVPDFRHRWIVARGSL